MLDRLERRGHITRGTRPGDRRVVIIELTSSGRPSADTIARALAEVEGRALGGLPAEAVAGFHTVLRALAEVSPGSATLAGAPARTGWVEPDLAAFPWTSPHPRRPGSGDAPLRTGTTPRGRVTKPGRTPS